ncbi:hypothetical protein M406DRAFT_348893 [Cryphonectria parasitica EP155]|uniref:Uncharacterized protein n=1 Tax=Cryphonectria parasitica (strain ATCC 38755 / EP155) TaxID=660469 RepID=A0A9P5CSP8_CRYP1|nr:uncharacterized protein M406DRAFT_348893 [Cryphonectria parasitica EP155]KAF3769819.1 hypothetical protein M406DRAFT_348893 [Cryphonectria parasitica EP155]
MAPFHRFCKPSHGDDGPEQPGWNGQRHLDHGTALFLEKLKDHAIARKNKGHGKAEPGLNAGLPRHLLRQDDERSVGTPATGLLNTQVSTTAPASVSKPQEQRLHSYLEERASNFYGFKTVFPGESRPQTQTPQHPYDHQPEEHHSGAAVQVVSRRPCNDSFPVAPASSLVVPAGMNRSTHQQPSSSHPPAAPARAYPEPSPKHAVYPNNKGAPQREFPPTPSYTNDMQHDVEFIPTNDRSGNSPAPKGMKTSRWAEAELQMQTTASPHHDNGARLSASTYRVDSPKNTQQETAMHVQEPNNGQKKPANVQPTRVVQPAPIPQQAHRQPSGNHQTKVSQVEHLPQPVKQKWRPKHDYDLESQSLPDTVSSVHFDDDEPVAYFTGSDAGDVPTKDIRGQIADESNLAPTGDGQGWYDQSQFKEFASDDDSWGPSKAWFAESVESWLDNTNKYELPSVWFLTSNIERHEHCDVNTFNGWLNAPVDYPETCMNPLDEIKPQETKRRLTYSSSLKSATNYTKNKRRLDNAEEMHGELVANPQPAQVPAQAQPQAQLVAANSAQAPRGGQMGQQVQAGPSVPMASANLDDYEQTYVKIPCFLRPAEHGDLEQVLTIYNWEVAHGTQAMDTKPLVVQDIRRIFQRCKVSETPFIVVIAGTAEEAVARKEVPARPQGMQPYMQRNSHQDQPEKREQDKVLAFGFITIPDAGLAGDVHHNVGRFQGRLYLYVAHDSRRNGLGRALLCRLTKCCSTMMISMGEYDWYDPTKNKACDVAPFNSRKYSRLFLETASKGKTDPDTKWYAEFLDSEAFTCVSTTDRARKIGYGDGGKWMDTIVWQYDCSDPKHLTEGAAYQSR